MNDLDRYVSERNRREPGFAQLVSHAERRLSFARVLAARRRALGKSQTQIAALMDTSASIVSRLESGSDVRVSTLEKYVAAIGLQLEMRTAEVGKVRRVPAKEARASAGKRVKRAAAKAGRAPG